MKRASQISESFIIGIMLAIAGGYMDSYSYLLRGHVFANAQTGNIVMFSINIAEGNFITALGYFLPIVVFAIGVMMSDIIRIKCKKILHWRQFSVLIQSIMLFFVAFIPAEFNLLANSIISLVCAIQAESFRKIKGNKIATTMCTGNLRSAAQYMCSYFVGNGKENFYDSILYLSIISFFIAGAMIQRFIGEYLGFYSILVCSVVHMLVFVSMFIDLEKRDSI